MHEIRMKMVTRLYTREMSPTQWFQEFGGGSYGRVLWHFKTLETHGWLRKVRNRKDVAGPGRSRDLYRATELAVIDDETWAELPISIQVAFTARAQRLLGERIGGALARGAVDSSASRLFSCRSTGIDDQGWQHAMAIMRDCFFSFTQEQLDAKVRLDTSPEQGVLMTMALVGFESPGLRASVGPELTTTGDVQTLRLSDEGGLPLSTRMAKVFGDPLSLQILRELHVEAATPSELRTKLRGDGFQEFDRRCRVLCDLGWAFRVEGDTGSRSALYKAAGPEAFDADLWGGIPKRAKRAESWPVFDTFCQKAEEALRLGSFNARQDRHVTFCTFLLDGQGRKQIIASLRRCYDRLSRVEADARARNSLLRSSPGNNATFFLAGFEDPLGDAD